MIVYNTWRLNCFYFYFYFIGCERTAGAVSGGVYINPIQSARLRTINSMSTRYGKVEVRAKLPKGDWLW